MSVEIPIRMRGGGVLTVALVDACDAKWVQGHRWHLRNGYVGRGERRADGSWAFRALHREILGLREGDPREADHINRDKLDNRRSNLRVVSRAQNSQNRPSQRGATSRFRGVSFIASRGKWEAAVGLRGRTHHLGRFDTEGEAAAAASAFRAQHMPYSEDARGAV